VRKATEFPLFDAVAMARRVKTPHPGKGLAGAVVICELWSLVVVM
jgi:hypothetical protein